MDTIISMNISDGFSEPSWNDLPCRLDAGLGASVPILGKNAEPGRARWVNVCALLTL